MMLEEKIHDTDTFHGLRISELKEQPEVVHCLLHEHEESYRKTNNLTLRKLSPGLKALIWFLRVYVLFMIVVAVIQVVHSIHPS